jgi:hypothetical protein
MRFRLTFVVIVLAALATGGPSAQSKELDNRTITCREFLASGQANMAALISWLRGYHAGKTGLSITRPLRRQAGLLLQATSGCQPHRRLRTNSDDDRSWYLTGRVAAFLAKIGSGSSLPLGGSSCPLKTPRCAVSGHSRPRPGTGKFDPLPTFDLRR